MYATIAEAGDSLLVVVVLGDDLHHVGHKVDGVKAHTELTDEIQVTTLLGHLQEGCKRRATSDQLLILICNQARIRQWPALRRAQVRAKVLDGNCN